MEPAETLAAARDGLTDVVERFARLVEGQSDTSIPIPGCEWTVRDATVHLAGGNQRYAALANGVASTVETGDVEYLAARARRLIAENRETDGKKLADQIRDVGALMAATARVPADEPIPYHAGTRPTLAQLVSLFFGEYLLHGYDIACAVGVPWPIDPAHAALALGGYRVCYPVIFHAPQDAEFEATYRIDTAGTDPFFVRIHDGAYDEPAAPASVDCVISSDPVTALFVMSGRLSQWAAIALGRLSFSGPRPDIGPRLAEFFVFP